METPNRREFLETLALAPSALNAQSASAKMIGIQVGAVSFLDEGVTPVLDRFQQSASINTLFVATFTYGRGIAGRQVPGQPLPDHGKQEHDLDFRGGAYHKTRPEFYRDTSIKDVRSRDYGDYDVLDAVLPEAAKRGMKVICWFEDVWRTDVPGVEQALEKDPSGRNANTLCFNNPNYRNWLLGMTEDYLRSYPVAGIMWGSERQGAFSNALGAMHGGKGRDPARGTCFCEYCQKKAAAKGIVVSRALEGYRQLAEFVRSARNGTRPVDGFYVTLWRLMLRYPELLAWEMLWTDSLRETYAAIYQKAKSVRADAGVGWHIWHNNSFNPIYRAEQDLSELSKYSDFLKMVMYHNCGGERIASYIDSVSQTIYGDVPARELLEFHYRVMNYSEKPYEAVPFTGLSSDYVLRETQRARAGLRGAKTLLWPGIDIDIPTNARHSKSTPEGTKAAVLAALRGGADGVLLSRKYSEMKLANLAAAGEAVREFGAA